MKRKREKINVSRLPHQSPQNGGFAYNVNTLGGSFVQQVNYFDLNLNYVIQRDNVFGKLSKFSQSPTGTSIAMNINVTGGVFIFNHHIYYGDSRREEIHEHEDDEVVPEEENPQGIARREAGEGGSRGAARGAVRGRRGGRRINPGYGRGLDETHEDPSTGPIHVIVEPAKKSSGIGSEELTPTSEPELSSSVGSGVQLIRAGKRSSDHQRGNESSSKRRKPKP